MKMFVYNNSSGEIELNEPEVLLLKEFSDLWKPERNITKSDPKGILRTKAFRECKYIFLMID